MEIQAVMPPPVPVSKAVRRGASPMRTLAWDARIQAMIDAVDEGSVSDMLGNLSGVNDVTIGGSSYAIETRNSYQAVPIEKATQYCHEYLTGLGLAASYDTYTWNGYTWRNVVGEQYGSASPDSVAVICAHLDDMPAAAVAPGADDNASGSTAVLLAASILKDYQFENTIRYVLFTGEEQGLRGSYYYVQDCVAAGDAIIGALNFDMIAWDSNADTLIEVHCGTTAESGTLGDLLISTISDYSLGLVAQKITSGSVTASDHARFWNAGYPAVLGIEDTWVSPTSDFNPYYHSVDDTRDHCVLSYTTNYVKAAVGTTARLAVPLAATPTPTPTPPWGMVNFQPASSAPAAGYWPDDGSPFGTHGDYGWR
jgi:Zn-dependent M28 family amino/carboxypeptidase